MKSDKKAVFKVFSKWILAGEHAVLRHRPALAFPLKSHFIELAVWPTGLPDRKKEKMDGSLPHYVSSCPFLLNMFKKALQSALKITGRQFDQLDHVLNVQLKSNVKPGVGLGSSAMVSVLIGLWFKDLKWTKKKTLPGFCYQLESTLQGQSSGLDIAAVLVSKPIYYKISPERTSPPSFLFGSKKAYIQNFSPLWTPHIYLSRPHGPTPLSNTKRNILKVQRYLKTRSKKSDELMKKAVKLANTALTKKNAGGRLNMLVESFHLAEHCFKAWGLIPPQMKKHADFLKSKGALAVKPTGSGHTGYMLSLWKSRPPKSLRLLPGFAKESKSTQQTGSKTP